MDENNDKLIFPLNVKDAVKYSGGLQSSDKIGIFVSFTLLICGISLWCLIAWLRPIFPNHYIQVSIGIVLVILVVLGSNIIRFFIDENSVAAEMSDEDRPASRYIKIYRLIKSGEGSYDFDVVEFDDCIGAFITCRLGNNTTLKSNNTYTVTKEFISFLNKEGVNRKVFYSTEDFKHSNDARNLMNSYDSDKSSRLYLAYRDIIKNYMDIAEHESNVMSVTYLLTASTSREIDDFAKTIHRAVKILQTPDTCFREVSILDHSQIHEMLRRYFLVGVLNIHEKGNTTRVRDNSIFSSIEVMALYGKNKKYINKDIDIRAEIINSTGIKRVR